MNSCCLVLLFLACSCLLLTGLTECSEAEWKGSHKDFTVALGDSGRESEEHEITMDINIKAKREGNSIAEGLEMNNYGKDSVDAKSSSKRVWNGRARNLVNLRNEHGGKAQTVKLDILEEKGTAQNGKKYSHNKTSLSSYSEQDTSSKMYETNLEGRTIVADDESLSNGVAQTLNYSTELWRKIDVIKVANKNDDNLHRKHSKNRDQVLQLIHNGFNGSEKYQDAVSSATKILKLTGTKNHKLKRSKRGIADLFSDIAHKGVDAVRSVASGNFRESVSKLGEIISNTRNKMREQALGMSMSATSTTRGIFNMAKNTAQSILDDGLSSTLTHGLNATKGGFEELKKGISKFLEHSSNLTSAGFSGGLEAASSAFQAASVAVPALVYTGMDVISPGSSDDIKTRAENLVDQADTAIDLAPFALEMVKGYVFPEKEEEFEADY